MEMGLCRGGVKKGEAEKWKENGDGRWRGEKGWVEKREESDGEENKREDKKQKKVRELGRVEATHFAFSVAQNFST